MRYRWASVIAGAALVFLASASAYAQSGASCPIGAPVTITATRYTLTNNDQCSSLIFTAASPITVTVPAANTVAPGFQVLMLPLYNGLTVTSPISQINKANFAKAIGPGQSALLMGDGASYWWGPGMGFGSIPATVAGGTMGTTLSNSPIFTLPNGVLQITNPASVIQGDGDSFAVCHGGTKMALGGPAEQANASQRGGPAWLVVLDALQRPFKIPLC